MCARNSRIIEAAEYFIKFIIMIDPETINFENETITCFIYWHVRCNYYTKSIMIILYRIITYSIQTGDLLKN